MTEIGTEAEGVMMIGTGGNNSNYTAILHVIFGRERIDYTQIPFGALFYHVTRLAFCYDLHGSIDYSAARHRSLIFSFFFPYPTLPYNSIDINI